MFSLQEEWIAVIEVDEIVSMILYIIIWSYITTTTTTTTTTTAAAAPAAATITIIFFVFNFCAYTN